TAPRRRGGLASISVTAAGAWAYPVKVSFAGERRRKHKWPFINRTRASRLHRSYHRKILTSRSTVSIRRSLFIAFLIDRRARADSLPLEQAPARSAVSLAASRSICGRRNPHNPNVASGRRKENLPRSRSRAP